MSTCPICAEPDAYDAMARLAHPQYHARYLANPDRWGPAIVKMRGRDLNRWQPPRSPRKVSTEITIPVVPRRSGTILASIIGPSVEWGGIQTWIRMLMKHVDPDRVTWLGNGAAVNPCVGRESVIAELAEFGPVVIGEDACRQMVSLSDVCLFWCIPHIAPLLSAGRPAPKVIVTAHASDTREYERNILRDDTGVSRYVAVSEAAARTIPAGWDYRVIPNAIDLDRVKPIRSRQAVHQSWNIRPGQKVILHLGRLSDEKNPELLAHTVAALNIAQPGQWRGVFVGPLHPHLEGLQARCRALAGGLVTFAGETSDVGSALAAADFVLIGSHEESFCFTAIEAWAAGVPVVATPVGVMAEHPDLCAMLPMNPTGDQTARLILTDEHQARCRAAQAVVADRYSAKSFGREWTNLIVRTAKKRLPLGINQKRPPEPDCIPCQHSR